MANKVLLKKSSVPSKVPLTSDLDYGELAINYADGKLYYKNNENIIKSFSDDSNSSADFPKIGTGADEIPLNQYLGALAYVDNISAGTGLTQETSGLSLTSITAGDNTVGAVKYNGTTKTAGQMYGGTSTPTDSTRLNYDGHLYATEMHAVNFDSTSDQRVKSNIVTIENALEKTLKLRGVEFDWKESGQHAIGVIAQEVEQIIPEVVNDNGELKSVSYGNIVGLLIEAIKEQQKQIEELQNKIK